MNRFLKADLLKKTALVAGLLLVLTLGLTSLPDLALRLYPNLFLDGQLHRIKRNMIRMHELLDRDEAVLSVLDQVSEHGLPHLAGTPDPSEDGVKQAIRREKGKYLENYGEFTELDLMRERVERLRNQKQTGRD